MGSDLRSFLTSGFCPEFYTGLDRLIKKLYYRYKVNDSLDVFVEHARAKVEDILAEGVYDASKGNFISFIHGMIRNEATKLKSKNKKADFYTDVHEYLEAPTSLYTVKPHTPQFRFLAHVEELAIPLDEEAFSSDVHEAVATPEVVAYLWLLMRRSDVVSA